MEDVVDDAWAVGNLGNIAYAQGNYHTARALFAGSLTILREIGERAGMAHSLAAFAELLVAQEQTKQTAQLWGAAQTLREEIDSSLTSSQREEYDRKVAATPVSPGEAAFSNA